MCKIITTNADAAAVAQFLFCLTSVWLRAVEADAEQVDPFAMEVDGQLGNFKGVTEWNRRSVGQLMI